MLIMKPNQDQFPVTYNFYRADGVTPWSDCLNLTAEESMRIVMIYTSKSSDFNCRKGKLFTSFDFPLGSEHYKDIRDI